jgi:hypothetical protein
VQTPGFNQHPSKIVRTRWKIMPFPASCVIFNVFQKFSLCWLCLLKPTFNEAQFSCSAYIHHVWHRKTEFRAILSASEGTQNKIVFRVNRP